MPAILDRCVKKVVKEGHAESSAYAICTASLKKAHKMSEEDFDNLSTSDILVLGMEFNTAHDIIHEANSNLSENCPVCKGDLEGKDAIEEAGKIIKKQRQSKANMHLWGGELDTKKREDLSDSDFAYIDSKGEKHLPIPDAAHVRNALARFNQTHFESPEDKTKAMDKIKSKAKEFGVDVSDKNAKKKASDISSDRAVKLHNVMVYPFTEIKASDSTKIPPTIQIMPIGEWDTVPYGKLEITANDCQEMVDNFKKGVRAGDTLPIDVDHDGKEAAGWMTDLYVADDGLWAKVDWTDLGQKLLGEKRYKFFSPEFNPDYIDPQNKKIQLSNVLIAGSLVNRPLFKELKPLMASDHLTAGKSGVMLFIETMNYKDLLAKKKAGENLSDTEMEFMKNHKADEGDEEDKESEAEKKKEADAAKKAAEDAEAKKAAEPKQVTITAAEYSVLKANADKAIEASEKLEAKEIDETINSWMFSETGGRFAPAMKDDITSFYKSLDDKQRKFFSEKIVNQMPESRFFKEYGSSEDLTKGGAADTITVKANELRTQAKKESRTLSFSNAVKQVLRENPSLKNYEMIPVQGRMVAR